MISAAQRSAIESTVASAEQTTSAEIKVVIRRHCWRPLVNAAEREFRELGLHQTRLRNAVLIYVVTTNREFLIFGDEGIHKQVGNDFWEETSKTMASAFASGGISDGVIAGVNAVAGHLAEHFPADQLNPNEISDEVIVDEE